MIEIDTGLSALPNGRDWSLPRGGSLDDIVLKKYAKKGDNISRVEKGYFESVISGIYARAEGKDGVDKDLAAIRSAVPPSEFTLGSLRVAMKNNDSTSSGAILGRMPAEELIKYSGDDCAIIAMRNKRILSKYMKNDKIVEASAEIGLGDLLNHIYAGAKKQGGLGMAVAVKDAATLINATPSTNLTLPILKVAIEHGDTPNAKSIAEKMPLKELSQYKGRDRVIINVKNERLQEEALKGSVQAKVIEPVSSVSKGNVVS